MNGWDDEYDNQYRGERTPRQRAVIRSGIILVATIAVIVLILLLAVGCADQRPQQLENSVRGYTTEIQAGDANKAFERVSSRCQDRLGRRMLTEAWGQVRRQWTGSPGIRSYTASIEGDRAEVTYRFEDPVWDQENEAWKWENNKWVNDEC